MKHIKDSRNANKLDVVEKWIKQLMSQDAALTYEAALEYITAQKKEGNARA